MKKLYLITGLFCLAAVLVAIAFLPKEKTTLTIPIVYVVDSQYVVPAAVSIRSAILNKNAQTRLAIQIIGIELTENEIKIFENLNQESPDCTVSIRQQKHKPQIRNFYPWTMISLHKFDIPEVFPEYDKVLYLDADTLILKDLTKLYETDITDYYVAAVKGALSVLTDDIKDTSFAKENYFSSAVMLLNCRKLRSDNIKEKLLAYQTDDIRIFIDNAYNGVLQGKVRFLPPAYNFETLLGTYFPLTETADFYGLSLKELVTNMQNPYILHFLSFTKPWLNKSLNPSLKLWKSYLKTEEEKNLLKNYFP